MALISESVVNKEGLSMKQGKQGGAAKKLTLPTNPDYSGFFLCINKTCWWAFVKLVDFVKSSKLFETSSSVPFRTVQLDCGGHFLS